MWSPVKGSVAYKFTENHSVSRCSEWMNDDVILDLLDPESFNRSALYRALDTLGRNRSGLLYHVRRTLIGRRGIDLRTTIMDRTSIHFEAEVSEPLRYGHSRDHRPNRPQVKGGVVQNKRSGIPVGMTMLPGNVNDQRHFKHTYGQVHDDLAEGSRVVFDVGTHGKPNVDIIVEDGMRYLSRMKLNNRNDAHILSFDKDDWELVDAEGGVHGRKLVSPSRSTYLFFSRSCIATRWSL